jgi:hypothetical protein
MILTEAEIFDITKKKRHHAQMRVLRNMNIEHIPRPDGSLVVLRSHVEHLLGGVASAKVEKEWTPDWSAL